MLAAAALAFGLLAPSFDAIAGDDPRVRPWGRGTTLVGPGFGLGLGSATTQLDFSLDGKHFVANGLALGLNLSDSVLILHQSLKDQYPGLNKKIPTNIFRLVPMLQFVFYRSRWFSPYVEAGVGPAFFNNRRGTFGHWIAGPGAYINLRGPVYLDIGVDFFGDFPVGRCQARFTATVPDATRMNATTKVSFDNRCVFGWMPKIGLVVALGGRGSKRRSKAAPPPSNPLPADVDPVPPRDPVVEPAPVPVPEPAPIPEADPSVPPPTDAPTETPPQDPSAPPPPTEGPTPPVAVPP